MKDVVETIAFNLTYILEQGAQGSHLLFRNSEIRRAFDVLADLGEVETAALQSVEGVVKHLATLPTIDQKRALVERLSEVDRSLLIVFYFQFLDRFIADKKPALH